MLKLYQVFAGPMSESIPSSTTGFAHRRHREDSTTSFTYYHEDAEPPSHTWLEAEVVEDASDEEDGKSYRSQDDDLESGTHSPVRRKSSSFSRISVEDPLLKRNNSSKSDSGFDQDGRTTQKIYIVTEDLTIVLAGFKTSKVGFTVYLALCAMSFGLAYLLLRWIPRWKVRLIGSPTVLQDCNWVVVEVSVCHCTIGTQLI